MKLSDKKRDLPFVIEGISDIWCIICPMVNEHLDNTPGYWCTNQDGQGAWFSSEAEIETVEESQEPMWKPTTAVTQEELDEMNNSTELPDMSDYHEYHSKEESGHDKQWYINKVAELEKEHKELWDKIRPENMNPNGNWWKAKIDSMVKSGDDACNSVEYGPTVAYITLIDKDGNKTTHKIPKDVYDYDQHYKRPGIDAEEK